MMRSRLIKNWQKGKTLFSMLDISQTDLKGVLIRRGGGGGDLLSFFRVVAY